MSALILHKTWNIPILVLLFPIVALLLSYYIALYLDHVTPMFPFLSHVTAYPPQSGLFCFSIEIAAFLGILTSFLRYGIVKQRMELMNRGNLDRLNKIGQGVHTSAWILFTFMVVCPIGFPCISEKDYILSVGVPHHVGALGSMALFAVHLLTQSYITYKQRRICQRNLLLHPLLTMVALACSIYIASFLYFVIEDIRPFVADQSTGLFAVPKVEYSLFPLMAAWLEWILGLTVVLFVASMYRDFRYMTVTFLLRPKLQINRQEITSTSHTPSEKSPVVIVF